MAFYTNVLKLGKSILYRGVDEDGKRYERKVKYKPKLFLPSNEPTKYTSLEGEYLDVHQPGDMKECYNFIERYKDVQDFRVFGLEKFNQQYITEKFPEDIEFDINLIRIANIDIETDCEEGFPDIASANEAINAITYYRKWEDVYYVFSNAEYGEYIPPEGSNIVHREHPNEKEMLLDFVSVWCEEYTDIITGWNIEGFDIPYIVHRLQRLFGEDIVKKMSPWGWVTSREFTNKYGQLVITYNFYGISNLDYIELYRKFRLIPRETYALDHICDVELDEKKLDYSEYGSLHLLYKHDYNKFIEYNIHDVRLVNKLETKLKLIELAIVLAYYAKINYTDVFSAVAMIESMCYNYLWKKNIVVPVKEHKIKQKFDGAYVKEPIPGMYEWVVSFDLTSLYPSLIMQLNLSPETLRPDLFNSKANVNNILNQEVDFTYLKDNNVAVAANGHHFDRTKEGFIPCIVKTLFDDRRKNKKTMLEYEQLAENSQGDEKRKYADLEKLYDIKQHTQKILLNSIYGAMGNEWFLFYDTRLAEAITLHGQLAIKWIARDINKYLNSILKTPSNDYVIAIDTDSNYLELKEIQKLLLKDDYKNVNKSVKALDLFAQKKLEPYINKSYEAMADYTNAYKQCMHMKREVIADKGVWTAKKRYALNVYNSEGVQYEEPKVKVKGLEVVKSSIPKFCRDKLKDAIHLILTKDEKSVIKFIVDVEKEFYEKSIVDIASTSSVNGLQKYDGSRIGQIYKLGTPYHVKGSLLYNKALEDYNITNEYEKIKNGDKVKIIYLKTPNKLHEETFAFKTKFPEETGLAEFVNYNKMFDKNFMKPLKSILDVIGWGSEDVNTFDDLFEEE